ncbi:MAG: iron donor protein CyaY [Planctomycetota bacterium]
MTTDADQQFLRQAEECMAALLRRIDEIDPDELEADSAAGVIKMRFADGSVCVLNRQSAAHQLWLAEGATAWHFVRDDSGNWMDTKGRGPLGAVLSELVSRKLGRETRF